MAHTAQASFLDTPAPLNVRHRAMITVSAIGATLLQSLDQTIANVALPYMQGSFSASYDEITWVLTSYITAAAIMTAPVGWMSTRFGRKPLYITCIVGFTVASMLCGAAQSLAQIVGFRLLQGMFGAALVPLSQATLLDIYPTERRGFAMAIWGMGVMIGPIMGPTLGGYLTDYYDWRRVFYINLPFGLLAASGLLFFLPYTREISFSRFDWLGFAVLSTAIGALQLMLDRGQDLDWFSAREIVIEAICAGLGFYLFTIHVFSARRPLIQPAMFKDVNFLFSLSVSQWTIVLTIMLQGAGLGLAFTPLQILAFATLGSSLRTEGASLLALLRNIGAAIGVSITSTLLARNTQVLHEVIGASATPFNRALQAIEAFTPRHITVWQCWTRWSAGKLKLSPI
jgi:multidrug resistance protein